MAVSAFYELMGKRNKTNNDGNLFGDVLNIFRMNNNCLNFGMSGSGATCYGIFNSRKDANDFERIIIKENNHKDYWIWSGGLLNKKRNLILPL